MTDTVRIYSRNIEYRHPGMVRDIRNLPLPPVPPTR